MKLNYYTYKTETFSCTKCNWTGLGAETFTSGLSEIHSLMDFECPKCESKMYTIDLAEENEKQKKLGNPLPHEKVCFNCVNMMWMVGIGQGVKCRLTMKNIPSRLYTCDEFKRK